MTQRKARPRKPPAKASQGGKKATPVESVGVLGALEKSLAAATWLTEADLASVELAKALAKSIDNEGATAQVASRLLDTLKAIGLTAISRKDLGLDKPKEEGSPLERIRTSSAVGAARVANSAHLYAVKE